MTGSRMSREIHVRFCESAGVRFPCATRLVVGFQLHSDAMRFQADLQARFARFSLEMHREKTRLIEFGRYARERREKRGEGKPETFDFLGFTHICSQTKRNGHFVIRRIPRNDRMRQKLKCLKEQLMKKRCTPVEEQGRWLKLVVQGWYNYYSVPLTLPYLHKFLRHVLWYWFRALRRRSQRTRLTWERMYRIANAWLPSPRILHPYPWERLSVIT